MTRWWQAVFDNSRVDWRILTDKMVRSAFYFLADAQPGAIGFDWFTEGAGCVSWLISWPRKKLITQ